MKWLKTYKIFESAIEIRRSVEFNKILNRLKLDPLWVENKDKMEHHEYDFRYDLQNGCKLAIIKINHNPNAYLIGPNGDFNYIDYLYDGFNKLFKYDDVLERFVKIAKISSQIYTKIDLYPDDGEFNNIMFPELREDLGFTFRESKFGFVDISFPKKESGTIKYRQSYEQEVYFPCDQNSQAKPKKVFIFDKYDDGDVTSEQLDQEFEDCKFRINELGFNLNSKLFITGTRYYNDQWRPEEFMIVLEEKI